jgi:hypothetical protein
MLALTYFNYWMKQVQPQQSLLLPPIFEAPISKLIVRSLLWTSAVSLYTFCTREFDLRSRILTRRKVGRIGQKETILPARRIVSFDVQPTDEEEIEVKHRTLSKEVLLGETNTNLEIQIKGKGKVKGKWFTGSSVYCWHRWKPGSRPEGGWSWN